MFGWKSCKAKKIEALEKLVFKLKDQVHILNGRTEYKVHVGDVENPDPFSGLYKIPQFKDMEVKTVLNAIMEHVGLELKCNPTVCATVYVGLKDENKNGKI